MSLQERPDYCMVKQFEKENPLMEKFSAFPARLYEGDPFYLPKPVALGGLPATFFLAYCDGTAAGRAAAVINPEISYRNQATGLIGCYECENDPSVSQALFDSMFEFFRARGIDYVIGPMNGTTWGSYRVTEPDDDPPFFLDNYHRTWYAEQFKGYGFGTIARYYSARITDMDRSYERVPRFEKLFKKKGIIIRVFNIDRFEEELGKIYELSRIGFKDNFLYTDIPYVVFKSMYESIKRFVNQEFVLLAEDSDGSLLGFIFCLDNVLERKKRSLVIKTVVVRPGNRSRGVGTLLVEKIHQRAFETGYDEIIHALMYEDNTSMNIVSDKADHFRTYLLFGRKV